MNAVLNGPFGSLPLSASLIKIGRSLDNQLVLQDVKVSSHHAEIHRGAHEYSIIDLQSTNGTYVNGQRLQKKVSYILCHLDSIRMGDVICTFVVITPEAESLTVYPSAEEGSYEPTIPASKHTMLSIATQSVTQSLSVSRSDLNLPPAKRDLKRYLPLLALINLGLSLVLAFSLVIASWLNALEPVHLLNAYCEALKGQNYATAYASLSSATQRELSLADFSTSLSSNGGVGKVIDCQVGDTQIAKTQSQGSIRYTFADQSMLESIYTLQKYGSSWKISNAPASMPHLMLTVYCSALAHHAPALAYNQLSSDTKQNISFAVFSRLFGNADIVSCNLMDVDVHGSSASTVITYGNSSGHSRIYDAHLIYEHGTWKLNSQQPE